MNQNTNSLSPPEMKLLVAARGHAENRFYDLTDPENHIGDSPIEILMFMALKIGVDIGCCEFGHIVVVKSSGIPGVENYDFSPRGLALVIQPQAQIKNYRVDFLLSSISPKGFVQVVVECDGHSFHERTKEQAKKDRSRDRWLQNKGYFILRFTGSEIYKDPNDCAEQVLMFMAGKVCS